MPLDAFLMAISTSKFRGNDLLPESFVTFVGFF
jgi:hypothetical protein